MMIQNFLFGAKKFFFTGLCLFSLFFFGCAQNETSITSVSATLVFDYEKSGSIPSQRLCVFVRSANEVQRVERLVISNEEANLTWTVEKPSFFFGNGIHYAYCNNLRPPHEKNIPEGKYSIRYVDSAGNEDESHFTIRYNSDIIAPPPEEKSIARLLNGAVYSLALYDEDGELLFLGKRKNTWSDDAKILKDYRIASFKRNMYSSADYSVLCIFPKEKIISQ